MDKTNSGNRKIKNDIIFISAIISLCIFVGLAFYFFRADGDSVTVSVDGELYGEFALGEDRTVQIVSDGGYNVLVIEGGYAYVESASCPDGICAAHKPISREGESIVCLPNKVVITVSVDSGEGAPDIIA